MPRRKEKARVEKHRTTICAVCGKEFSPHHGAEICCSSACKEERARRRSRDRYRVTRGVVEEERQCPRCGKVFLSTHPTQKYCGACKEAHAKEYQNAYNHKRVAQCQAAGVCVRCGAAIEADSRSRQYCQKCLSEAAERHRAYYRTQCVKKYQQGEE